MVTIERSGPRRILSLRTARFEGQENAAVSDLYPKKLKGGEKDEGRGSAGAPGAVQGALPRGAGKGGDHPQGRGRAGRRKHHLQGRDRTGDRRGRAAPGDRGRRHRALLGRYAA